MKNANGYDASSDGKVAKVRKCCAVSDPKNKGSKITHATIYCSICLVSLCTKMIGNRRKTYFEHFHQITNPSDLYGKKRPLKQTRHHLRREGLVIMMMNKLK